MTIEELEATVRAQGCLIRALTHRLAKPAEPLPRLVADQIKLVNDEFSKSGDQAAMTAFKSAYQRMQNLLPMGV